MIRYELSDGVAVITLDRADKRNALTPAMLDEVPGLIDRAATERARVILFRGDGPAFCAGFDLKMCLTAPDGSVMRALLTGLSLAVESMLQGPLPVVCEVQGAAIAGGCALLGGCDLVLTEPRARFGYPVTRLGVSPAVSGPFARAMLGDGPARSALLCPELFGAEQAWRIGLVHEIAETPDKLRERAQEAARSLASKPAAGIRHTRAWLNEITRATESREAALEVSVSLTGSEEECRGLEAAMGPRNT